MRLHYTFPSPKGEGFYIPVGDIKGQIVPHGIYDIKKNQAYIIPLASEELS